MCVQAMSINERNNLQRKAQKNEDEYWFFMLLDVSSFRVFWYLTHTCIDVWIKIHHHYCLLCIPSYPRIIMQYMQKRGKKSGESWMRMKGKGWHACDNSTNGAHFLNLSNCEFFFKKKINFKIKQNKMYFKIQEKTNKFF